MIKPRIADLGKNKLRHIILTDARGRVLRSETRQILVVGSLDSLALGVGNIRKKVGNGIKYIKKKQIGAIK